MQLIKVNYFRIGNVVLISLLGACSINAPKTKQELSQQSLPAVEIPQQFQGGKKAVPETVPIDDAWLKQFNDAELNQLIDEALKNNPDIKVIAARRSQSESLIDAATGAQYPSVNAIGNTGGKVGSSGTGTTGYYIGANWELDLWGRVRTSIAGAQQNAKAIQADQNAAHLSLIAGIAKAVWFARGLQEQARLANLNAHAAKKQADLVAIRERVGASSLADLSAARIGASQAKEFALSSEQSRDQALRAVEILVGRYPKAQPLKTSALPKLPNPVAPGLPADLLERRPDIVAAEARVNSAFYLADEKRLARLPKISLTGGFGYINSQIFTLVNGPTTNLGAGANLMMPIFQGGAIEAQIAYQNAEAKAALANYGKVVLAAFNDVENALTGEATWRERSNELQIQLDEQKQFLARTEKEFEIGRVDQRSVQQQMMKTNSTEISWRQGKIDALVQRVNLYLALGGSAD